MGRSAQVTFVAEDVFYYQPLHAASIPADVTWLSTLFKMFNNNDYIFFNLNGVGRAFWKPTKSRLLSSFRPKLMSKRSHAIMIMNNYEQGHDCFVDEYIKWVFKVGETRMRFFFA